MNDTVRSIFALTWSAARVYPKGNRGVENVLGGTWRGEPVIARILPLSVAERDFDLALREWRSVVGPANVVDSSPGLDGYRDAYSPLEDNAPQASAAVLPNSVEQVQEVMRIASRYGLPVWPISTGRNLAYGGAAPRMSGTVMLDLKRMNRILEVNDKYCYALVEPGVTYFDLYRHIQEKKLPLWLSVPAPGWGSVLGNALERGLGYTPYGDHFGMQCGMEVVLANGDLMRTGMGAMDKSESWQLFKYGFGPYIDGLFTQSNYGVVTKMGMWLMPAPQDFLSCSIYFENEEDLEQIVEVMRPLKIALAIPNAATIYSAVVKAASLSVRADFYKGEGAMPPDALRKMISELGIGFWNLSFALYGPTQIVEGQWAMLQQAFGQIKGARFQAKRLGDDLTYRDLLQAGVPNMGEFNTLNWVPNSVHMDFSPISALDGAEAVKQYKMISARANQYGFDYFGAFIAGWREMHHIFALGFNKDSQDEKARARKLFAELIDTAAAEGYGEYRTHLAFMDRVAGTYGFNDHAALRFSETIKNAIDPKGIIAPGKQGIWPQRFAAERGKLG